MFKTNKILTLTMLLFTVQYFGFTQTSSLKSYDLDSIVVSVGRIENPLLTTPKSVSSLQISKIQDARQQLSVNDYLLQMPGLFGLNANNFAQDLRLSIRGFGARSAFGIRGVRILVDGIPETTPDGQGQVDNLDLGLMQNIQVLRGPSSGLYGNASGGVMSITTQSEVYKNFLEASSTFGSFGFQRYQLKAGLTSGKTDVVFNGSYNELSGFRQNSGLQHATISTNVRHQISDNSNLRLIFNYTNSPQADDPGGVDLESVEKDREAARDRNLLFDTGEEVSQLKIAGIYNVGSFQTKAYLITRDFYGKLPFGFGGIVDLSRTFIGNSSNYRFITDKDNARNELLIGYDLQFQNDDRQRFRNLEGGEQGDLDFHQEENFRNFALFLTDQLEVGKWNINGNLRYDFNQLTANDLILSNGDASGEIDLNTLNGGIGVSFNNSLSFIPFGRFSTSFETPTLSELSANPSGEEGFNPELEPQQAVNFEVGVKGLLNGKFQYELVLFRIQTTNEILPYEIADFPDRDFFRNAGETLRNGVELALEYAVTDRLRLSGNYTFSDFQFQDFTAGDNTFDGEQLPGIPMHIGAFAVRYINAKGLFFKLTAQRVGDLFADNANNVNVEGYNLVNLNAGYAIQTNKWTFTPFFGINNLLDATYNDNIRINAFGGRFYEPAPGISFFGGVRVRIE